MPLVRCNFPISIWQWEAETVNTPTYWWSRSPAARSRIHFGKENPRKPREKYGFEKSAGPSKRGHQAAKNFLEPAYLTTWVNKRSLPGYLHRWKLKQMPRKRSRRPRQPRRKQKPTYKKRKKKKKSSAGLSQASSLLQWFVL